MSYDFLVFAQFEKKENTYSEGVQFWRIFAVRLLNLAYKNH